MITLSIRRTAVAAALLLSPGVANAAAVPFFGHDLGLGENTRLTATPNSDAARTAFIAEVGGGQLESFESLEHGGWAATQQTDGSWTLGRELDFAGSFGTGGGNVTGTFSARTGTVHELPSGTFSGRYPTHGDKFFHSQADEITFVFDQAIHGFGFDGIDLGDFSGQLTVDIYDGDNLLHAITVPHAIDGLGGDVLFWGFADIENPFTKVVFSNTNPGGDVFAIDQMLIATPVPGALPLLATGVAALVWARRRRAAAEGQ